MKVRFVITLLIAAFCQQADAQQLPLYSNYVLNYFRSIRLWQAQNRA